MEELSCQVFGSKVILNGISKIEWRNIWFKLRSRWGAIIPKRFMGRKGRGRVAVISIEEYEKSLLALDEAFARLDTRKDEIDYRINRDACIQRFEFCVALAWKTSVRVLGLNATAPKVAIREMARAGLISDIQKWFEFIDARNRSSHTYDEGVAIEVLSAAKKFSSEGWTLMKGLKAR
ncbi:MAG: hypothetical protein EA369_04290 [Bradymonadales bacterium]|nr:MAG: hypothetical protein EA369_04290 [Bradymonadales bacterium]